MSNWNHTENCPNCKTKVLFDFGDSEDVTLPDPELLQCPKCEHIWTDELGYELLKDLYGEDWKEEAYVCEGTVVS